MDALTDLGREDLLECAELGVSELVTNAILHGLAPVLVQIRGTRAHPRVEVHDGSTALPTTHDLDLSAVFEDDDPLSTFGRGLDIVARCSEAWGTDLDEHGKTVWFVPAAEFGEPTSAQLSGLELRRPPLQVLDPVRVHLRAAPVLEYAGFAQHFNELHREVRLLALAARSVYPLAEDLSALFAVVETELRDPIAVKQVSDALLAGNERADLDFQVSRSFIETIERFLDLLDLADGFCRQQRLLSLARTPSQRRFQQWFLGEFLRQADGAAPSAWADQHPGGVGSTLPSTSTAHSAVR